MYAQIPDSQTAQQFRAVKSILVGAFLLLLGVLAALSATLGIFRNLPRLTLSKDKFELRGVFKTVTICWAELGPCVLNSKGTLISSAITRADIASGTKIPRTIIIPGMKGDMTALADDLNHRIASARGEDYSKIIAVVEAEQAKNKSNDNGRQLRVARGRCRAVWLLGLGFGLMIGGLLFRVSCGLPPKPYDGYIVFGSFVVALIGSNLIAKRKYPDQPRP
jgi:hypothetical protein